MRPTAPFTVWRLCTTPLRIANWTTGTTTLAKIIQQELLRELKTVDRGLIPRPNLVVTRETKMPAVIAELGFLTNSNERALLLTEDYRQRCAQALSNGIVRYVNEILLTNE